MKQLVARQLRDTQLQVERLVLRAGTIIRSWGLFISLACVVLTYFGLVCVCELRIREPALRSRMSLAANLIVDPPLTLGAAGRSLDDAGVRHNRVTLERLVKWCKAWDSLESRSRPVQLLKLLNKITLNNSPDGPSFPQRLHWAGDYEERGLDVRVDDDSDVTKEIVVNDARRFLRVLERYDSESGTYGFVVDPATPFRPADEYRFYDPDRDRLNLIVLGGVASALGLMFWSLRLTRGLSTTEPDFDHKRSSASAVPAEDHTHQNARRQFSWVSALLTLIVVIVVQILQSMERRELYVEGWVNHPAGVLVVVGYLTTVGVLWNVSRRRLSSFKTRPLEEHLAHYRSVLRCAGAIGLVCLVIGAYSLLVLWPSDATRACIQIGICVVVVLVLIGIVRRVLATINDLQCRKKAEPNLDELVFVGNYSYELLMVQFDWTLLANIIAIVLAVLLIVLGIA